MPARTRRRILLATVAALLVADVAGAAPRTRLELRYLPLELPGAPATILPADLDGDGRQDLAVAVAYTEWDQIGIEDSTEMDDVERELGIEGLVEVLTIVPSLMDRRELWVFLAGAGGGYEALAPMALDRSVLSIAAGPPGLPVVALTDDGLAALRLTAGRVATLEPVFSDRPVLAGTGNFVPGLGLGHDLDGDGRRDLLFPTPDGAAVYLGVEGGLDREPAARWRWPVRDHGARTLRMHYPLPAVADVDGDGLADLLLHDPEGDWRRFQLLLNAGRGRFAEAIAPLDRDETGDGPGPVRTGDETADPRDAVAWFGDLDGDGVAEIVTQEDLADDDAGMRKEIREAKRRPYRYRFYRTRADLQMADQPYLELVATGYALDGGGDGDGDGDIRLPGGFQDLDGDGRQDLVTLTLDFSVMQAVRILATHRISIGLDFHVWCQQEDGGFRAVTGLDLSGKFRLDLDDLRIGQLSQFAGDFDADGRADFVQMGRGRDVTLHRGRDGCLYPPEPDLSIRLEAEPRDLQLVQVSDFDADGLADLLVIQPQKVLEPGVTPPVRLDLYLSGDGE